MPFSPLTLERAHIGSKRAASPLRQLCFLSQPKYVTHCSFFCIRQLQQTSICRPTSKRPNYCCTHWSESHNQNRYHPLSKLIIWYRLWNVMVILNLVFSSDKLNNTASVHCRFMMCNVEGQEQHIFIQTNVTLADLAPFSWNSAYSLSSFRYEMLKTFRTPSLYMVLLKIILKAKPKTS